MIIKSPVWFDVVPTKQRATNAEIGKWLYFGEKALLHGWLPRLDELIEAGELRAAKVSRKDADSDPFPHKPCVVCVYTTDTEKEKAHAKRVLAREFGVEVTTWKSDAQTSRDWAEDGWLRIESQITEIKRALARGELPDAPAIQQQLRSLTDRLSELVAAPKGETLAAELELSHTDVFLANLKRTIASGQITLATILDHLDKLQMQVSRISEAKPANPGTSESGVSVRSDYLFVIMPFGTQHIDTYDAIRRGILKVHADLKVERVDEQPGSFAITEGIWKSIRRARLVICDLTDERPNVYYELGYAHALGKPMVCVARTGTNIHFDLSGFKMLFFNTYRELEESLIREVGGSLAATSTG